MGIYFIEDPDGYWIENHSQPGVSHGENRRRPRGLRRPAAGAGHLRSRGNPRVQHLVFYDVGGKLRRLVGVQCIRRPGALVCPFVMLSGMFMLDPKRASRCRASFLGNILRVFSALVVWGAGRHCRDFGRVGGRFTWMAFSPPSEAPCWATPTTTCGSSMSSGALSGHAHSPRLRPRAGRRDFHYFSFSALWWPPAAYPCSSSGPARRSPPTWLNLHMVMGYVGFLRGGVLPEDLFLGRLAEVIIFTSWAWPAAPRRCGHIGPLPKDGGVWWAP